MKIHKLKKYLLLNLLQKNLYGSYAQFYDILFYKVNEVLPQSYKQYSAFLMCFLNTFQSNFMYFLKCMLHITLAFSDSAHLTLGSLRSSSKQSDINKKTKIHITLLIIDFFLSQNYYLYNI